MNDNAEQPILSTRIYNALLRATTEHTPGARGSSTQTTMPSHLDPAVIRQAIKNGSIYGFRSIGPKSIAQIKRWLADQPATEPTQPTRQDDTMSYSTNPTVHDIMESLTDRGFLQEINYFDPEAIQTQLDAVIEEIGEIARCLRRARQSNSHPDIDQLAVEAADVTIAATCLLATVAGDTAPQILAAKLAADDKRLWLHSGLTRDQYEQTHGNRN